MSVVGNTVNSKDRAKLSEYQGKFYFEQAEKVILFSDWLKQEDKYGKLNILNFA